MDNSVMNENQFYAPSVSASASKAKPAFTFKNHDFEAHKRSQAVLKKLQQYKKPE